MQNLNETITALTGAFSEFKTAQTSRIDAIEKQLETDATVAASRQMGNFDTKPASRFQAHYSKKPDFQANSEPVEMQAFLKGIAGLKTPGKFAVR